MCVRSSRRTSARVSSQSTQAAAHTSVSTRALTPRVALILAAVLVVWLFGRSLLARRQRTLNACVFALGMLLVLSVLFFRRGLAGNDAGHVVFEPDEMHNAQRVASVANFDDALQLGLQRREHLALGAGVVQDLDASRGCTCGPLIRRGSTSPS